MVDIPTLPYVQDTCERGDCSWRFVDPAARNRKNRKIFLTTTKMETGYGGDLAIGPVRKSLILKTHIFTTRTRRGACCDRYLIKSWKLLKSEPQVGNYWNPNHKLEITQTRTTSWKLLKPEPQVGNYWNPIRYWTVNLFLFKFLIITFCL